MHGHSLNHSRSHPYNAGTEHVGFPPTRQTLLALSAKGRVFAQVTQNLGLGVIVMICAFPVAVSNYIT